jgi:hypothetical protein
LLALCAFTPVSRADVIVDNTGAVSQFVSGSSFAQVFTMSGTSGNLSSLTLNLDVVGSGGSAQIDLYNVSAGAPTTLATALGTVSSASTGSSVLAAVSLSSNPLLTAGGTYAVVMEYPSTPSGSLAWNYTTGNASGGTGSFGGIYFSTDHGANWNVYSTLNAMQMNLQTTPVPEVPMTGVVMGFGALAIALGHTLRRKLSTAVSSIA